MVLSSVRHWLLHDILLSSCHAPNTLAADIARRSSDHRDLYRGVWVRADRPCRMAGGVRKPPADDCRHVGAVSRRTRGWRRWLAIAAGFSVSFWLWTREVRFFRIVIPSALGAAQFAAYGILTRMVGRSTRPRKLLHRRRRGAGNHHDRSVCMNPPVGTRPWWMLMLCLTGTAGHFLMIKAWNLPRPAYCNLRLFRYRRVRRDRLFRLW